MDIPLCSTGSSLFGQLSKMVEVFTWENTENSRPCHHQPPPEMTPHILSVAFNAQAIFGSPTEPSSRRPFLATRALDISLYMPHCWHFARFQIWPLIGAWHFTLWRGQHFMRGVCTLRTLAFHTRRTVVFANWATGISCIVTIQQFEQCC